MRKSINYLVALVGGAPGENRGVCGFIFHHFLFSEERDSVVISPPSVFGGASHDLEATLYFIGSSMQETRNISRVTNQSTNRHVYMYIKRTLDNQNIYESIQIRHYYIQLFSIICAHTQIILKHLEIIYS